MPSLVSKTVAPQPDRSRDSVIVSGLSATIQRRRAEEQCAPDPRRDGIPDDWDYDRQQEAWDNMVADGHARAEALAQERIQQGCPILLIFLHPGGLVPDIAFVTEGLPLRLTVDDVIEIDSDATVDRRRRVNHYRESQGRERIEFLEGPGWVNRLRRWLDGSQSPPNRRGRNGVQVR
jgi:hypothetical protein